jgi:hypothetical protein
MALRITRIFAPKFPFNLCRLMAQSVTPYGAISGSLWFYSQLTADDADKHG